MLVGLQAGQLGEGDVPRALSDGALSWCRRGRDMRECWGVVDVVNGISRMYYNIYLSVRSATDTVVQPPVGDRANPVTGGVT